MSTQFPIHVIPFIAAAFVAILQAIGTWRSKKPEDRTASVILVAVAIWTLGTAFEVVSLSAPAKVWWDRISFIGIILLPPAWLLYVVQYTWKDRRLAMRTIALVSFLPLIALIVVFTNDYHHLLWTAQPSEITNAFVELPKTRGPGFLIFAIYSYLITALGVFVLVHLLVRSRRLYRWQVAALLFACITTLTVNILEIVGVLVIPFIDITAVLLAVTVPVIVWLIRRLRFGEIVVVAWGTVTDKMSDAVIVLDAHNEIVDVNPAAEKLLKQPSSEVIGKPIKDIWSDWIGFQESLPFDVERGVEIESEANGKKIYDMRVSPLLNWRKVLVSRIIVLRDITELKRSESKLRDTNLRLEIALAELKEAQDTIIKQERSAAVGQLASGIFDEFNRALRSVVQNSEKLLKSSRLSSGDRKRLDTILDSAVHAVDLLDQILSSSNSSETQ